MAEEADYYAILEVSPGAGEEEIRLAFRRLARRYHPDVAGTGDLAHMQRLNVAYQTLSDPDRRRAYDRGRGLRTAETTRPAPYHQAAPSRAGVLRHSAGPLSHLATLAAGEGTPAAALAFARGGAVAGTGLIDGTVVLWDLPSGRPLTTLTFGPKAPAGVLQELRLSPSGSLAVAWGLLLGTRVWRVEGSHPLWTAGIHGPSGSMDAILTDTPSLVRLVVPDAPLALADSDPFRWAHEGRHGSAVYTRPLAGPVAPIWAVPRRCPEDAGGGRSRQAMGGGVRVHQRLLSADGQRLLTVVATPTGTGAPSAAIHVWEIEHRSMLGTVGPRRTVRVPYPAGASWFPLAVTPDLSWVATAHTPHGLTLIAPQSRLRRTIPTGAVLHDARLALAADGSLLALALGARLELWRTADGSRVQEWEFAAEVTAFAFAGTPDRPLLGVGLSNGLTDVWAH